jgi:2-haloacid dehalogenase
MLQARVPGKVLPVDVDVDVEIIAFDVFGTLVDWHTSIAAALAEVGGRAGIDADWAALASAWRARYRPTLARVVAGELPFESLDTLHRIMLDELAADSGPGGRGGPGVPLQALSDADRDELVRAWHRLRPWPDSVPALTKLREHHILTPLSNGGMGLLTRLARAAGLPFDCILSAELAGTYKPDPRVYRLVSRYLDVPPDRVLMVACHPDDLEAAAREGLRTGFIPRPREWGPDGTAPPPPDDVDVAAGDLLSLAALI